MVSVIKGEGLSESPTKAKIAEKGSCATSLKRLSHFRGGFK